jgi:hypothetical protein
MKFWLAFLVAAAASIGTAAAWWQRDHDWWRPPAPSLPEVPAIAPLPEPAAPAVAEATQRPLLWSTRRPPPPPRAPSVQDRLLEEINQSRLLAVVQSGDQRVALLRTPDGRVLKLASQSRPVWLEFFDGRRAHFVTDDGQRASRPLEPQRPR